MDWQQLSTTSHYETAVAIARELEAGNVQEAAVGIQELIDAMARSERRALRSQLIRLMAHILKWMIQPQRRSSGWAVSIYQAREEIAAIQEEVPSLTRKVLEELWERCFAAATRQAQAEMNQKVEVAGLSWEEVFEADYTLEDSDGEARS
jgi:hypothetical protein